MSGEPPQYIPQGYPPPQDKPVERSPIPQSTQFQQPSFQGQQPLPKQNPGVGMPSHVYPQVNPGIPPQNMMGAVQMGQNYQAQLFAMCAQGVHDPQTKYGKLISLPVALSRKLNFSVLPSIGVGGIIAAVLCFPLGLIGLLTTLHPVWNLASTEID
ncbi:hypothetical protein D9757_010598 [Collybiopsis confluens]|uniref:Uncharacterized protein n=1 Tax=Collybiopsis confluens TaxID=2823264 RepID=A0A8H5GVP5_9AGAR|nr:hypothetical protein D9757_010598 [Collybiopsis confluens]